MLWADSVCCDLNRETASTCSNTALIVIIHLFVCQVQDVVPITSCDTAGSFLLLGCSNGSIYYIGTHSCLTSVCQPSYWTHSYMFESISVTTS